MAKNKKKKVLGVGVIAAIGLLAFAFVASGSGGGVVDQNAEGNEGEVTIAASAVTNSINYQGRLTHSSTGEPLGEMHDMTFRLYNVSSEGTALATDTHAVDVTDDGLFNTNIDFDQSYFDGRALWLGITVGEDAEMMPRQELRPAPYALSLKPGAVIASSGPTALTVYSGLSYGLQGWSLNNIGLLGISGPSYSPPAGMHGVHGVSEMGVGVYGKGGDTGIYGNGSNDGVKGESINGNAVHGLSTNGYGVLGESANSAGVKGHSDTNYGVYGEGGEYGGFFTTNQGGSWDDHNAGVNATTAHDWSDGVHAYTTGVCSIGVRASSANSYGVYGMSESHHHAGVYGDSSKGTGVEGVHTYPSYTSPGVYGRNTGSGCGVLGDGGSGAGVIAKSASGNPLEAYDTSPGNRRFYVSNSGHVYADGSFHPGGADVAEYFPTPEDPEPGTVMTIDPAGGSKLRSSTNAYDTTVAGIVSTAPGVSLGTNETGNEGEKLIAVAGRVPCKVDATYAPIKPGDLLTTSDTPGHAMKAQPVVIGGVEIYRSGTTLGKALEPLDSGTGVIEVLVTLQ